MGAISTDHAQRLWHLFPLTAQALVEAGPDLLDTFIPEASLRELARAHATGGASWLARLDELAERRTLTPSLVGPQQSDLFEQYTRVLQAVAQQGPLVLVLDDLQWADLGSISLLFHLGRRLQGSHILIAGAYRSEDVAIGRDGERHPLDPVVKELQRYFGNISVNLGQVESRDLVEAILDAEPNRLGVAFREMLYGQTHGHPLFTVELLRGLQERGDLAQDPEGRWKEGPTLDWETLPARVEAVFAERVARLGQPLRAALRVASVEGEVFTAEVVARAEAAAERETVRRLSDELDRKHRLIRAHSIVRVDGQLLSRYRFRHFLFQRYLYHSLDEVERVHLHDQVGSALEELYQASEVSPAVKEVAVQLARHFEEAGRTKKTIYYLHAAGERAVQLSAYQEAVAHLTRGLNLLMTLPDTPARVQQELDLQVSLARACMGDIPSRPWERAITRARELCQQTGKTTQLWWVLGELSIFHYVRAEYQKAWQLGQEALSVAEQVGDPLVEAVSHWYLGFILFGLGEYVDAHAHLENTISFYEPQQHHEALVLLRGSDAGAGALAYDACCLWCLGYPEQAWKRSQEAIALARQFNHVFSLVDVLCYAGCLFHEMLRDAQALKHYAEEMTPICATMGFSSFEAIGMCYKGEALIALGQLPEGTAQLREGLVVTEDVGAKCHRAGALVAQSWAQAKAGYPDQGLATLVKALAFLEEADERHWEAELLRMQGELLLAQRDEAGAEASFHRAIEVARRQQARSWELRATMSLCRLWQSQGRIEEAREVLAEIYGWFTEGFDTPDLIDARALLKAPA